MMSRGEIVAFQRTLETLRSNDADGNEKVKKKRFNKQNNNFPLFCTFLSRFPVKMPYFAFMEDVNKQRRNFISLSELGYGHLKFSFRRVRLYLTK